MGRLPDRSPVFESFWRFAAERHAIYQRRLAGIPAPWTEDPVLGEYRFTNVFRASDRVSQYLIRDVIYADDDVPAEDVVFRIVLFRLFNKIDTWQLLTGELGPPTLGSFEPAAASQVLARARAEGRCIYSSAYIIPPRPGWPAPKHTGHLQLAVDLLEDGLTERIESTADLGELFRLLRSVPGLGDFLAYQLAIDLCYSTVVHHDEDEFVIAGPGALDGLSKVFPRMDRGRAAEVIRALTDDQERWFEHYGLTFSGLLGRRLHLIDVQNLFCEISKYARVAHPEVSGVAGRTRIKQTFRPLGALPEPFFPPKWGLPTRPTAVPALKAV